jgi:hypothetical protein
MRKILFVQHPLGGDMKTAIRYTIAALFATTLATAQTWNGSVDRDWGTADNWDGGDVPADGANVTFTATGEGGVNLGDGETRIVENMFIGGTPGAYRFRSTATTGADAPTSTLQIDGLLTSSVTSRIVHTVALTGSGGLNVTGQTLRLGESGNMLQNNTFSGGVRVNNGTILLEYFGPGTDPNRTPLGTGAITMGTGVNGSQGGFLALNNATMARMTYANDFVNAITRDGDLGPNAFGIRFDGGIADNAAVTTRYTGNFSTAELPVGATGHGWTVFRGKDVTDGSRRFGAATFEFSGDWTGYAPTGGSKLAFAQAAYVIDNVLSVANHTYTLNAASSTTNNSNTQSTVLALGSGFGANTFNRDITIEVGSTGNNDADAINQTFIGGRQGAGVTNGYSGDISFATATGHRLNLFSDEGRTEFTGDITAGAQQIIAINSTYEISTYTTVAPSGITGGNAITTVNPEGVVVFGGTGTMNFGGGVEVVGGTLLVNRDITGNVSVATDAVLGRDGGASGTITGNLTLSNGAFLAFDPNLALDPDNALTVTGSLTLDSSFGVESLRTTTGDFIDWASVNDGVYTLLGTSFTFNETNISNFGQANAFDIGGGREAFFDNGSLQLHVIPEPGTLALVAIALGSLALFRRRR